MAVLPYQTAKDIRNTTPWDACAHLHSCVSLLTDVAATPAAPRLPSTRAARSITVLLALHGLPSMPYCPWRSVLLLLLLLCCVRLLCRLQPRQLLLPVLRRPSWFHPTPPCARPPAVQPLVLLLLVLTARPMARLD